MKIGFDPRYLFWTINFYYYYYSSWRDYQRNLYDQFDYDKGLLNPAFVILRIPNTISIHSMVRVKFWGNFVRISSILCPELNRYRNSGNLPYSAMTRPSTATPWASKPVPEMFLERLTMAATNLIDTQERKSKAKQKKSRPFNIFPVSINLHYFSPWWKFFSSFFPEFFCSFVWSKFLQFLQFLQLIGVWKEFKVFCFFFMETNTDSSNQPFYFSWATFC